MILKNTLFQNLHDELFIVDCLLTKNMAELKKKIDVEESCKRLTGLGFMNASKTMALQYSGT